MVIFYISFAWLFLVIIFTIIECAKITAKWFIEFFYLWGDMMRCPETGKITVSDVLWSIISLPLLLIACYAEWTGEIIDEMG